MTDNAGLHAVDTRHSRRLHVQARERLFSAGARETHFGLPHAGRPEAEIWRQISSLIGRDLLGNALRRNSLIECDCRRAFHWATRERTVFFIDGTMPV